ncbi:L-2-amino-thiazoline-4-carboxylic acid hydrolase [Abyssisolibacter fermentans]|uniref:L-2-amino-thiazoline-4-carboxylic acid hydrolase n=1 Tax=Abyssisolibacter fermentans TaxID=1766203 RepID=UPI0008324909|nr:L-2-amino-thiazoline-4-carboxylic acid hydrolase [Abyssisolibacter fermentans]
MGEMMYTQKEFTDAFRSAIEDRATWFYLLLNAAEELGGDPDKIAEIAITRFGKMKGKKMEDSLGRVTDAGDFVKKLSEGPAFNAFEMERVRFDEKQGELKFRYCALVEAWKKLGCSAEEISRLCKLASYGDFGVVSCFPSLNLEFKQLLANGDECCHMVVTPKEEK